jgi:cytidylate kinase
MPAVVDLRPRAVYVREDMSVITISASYGSGGSEVAPRLAEQLGAKLLDRAIPAEVAGHLAVPLDQALHRDESVGRGLDRFFGQFASAAVALGAMAPGHAEGVPDEESYARAVEAVIREHAGRGDVVVLGRAAAMVLRERRDAFHVRLDGPPAARTARAMAMQGISRSEAERQLKDTDQAREAYVRHLYNSDPRDARHYHLVLDATAYRLDDLVDIIKAAYRARESARAAAPPGSQA